MIGRSNGTEAFSLPICVRISLLKENKISTRRVQPRMHGTLTVVHRDNTTIPIAKLRN